MMLALGRSFSYGVAQLVAASGQYASSVFHAPIDNSYGSSISQTFVRRNSVIRPRVLEAFRDRKGRAWKDRFQ